MTDSHRDQPIRDSSLSVRWGSALGPAEQDYRIDALHPSFVVRANADGGGGAPVLPQIDFYDADEHLLRATVRDGRPRIKVYRPERTAVVLGRGSDPLVELNIEACLADGVPIMRRRGGGCAVVLDSGNVVVSAAVPVPDLNHTRRHFDLVSTWLLERLHSLGFEGLYRDGIFDFVHADRKVGGACVYRSRGLLFFSTTLLVSPDLAAIDRYLRLPPREPDYRRGRAHRDFLGHLPIPGGRQRIESFIDRLDDRLVVDDLPLLEPKTTYQA